MKNKNQDLTDNTPVAKAKVPFSIWVDKKIKAGKLRDHQKLALLVFLNKQGLGPLEDADQYEKAFLKF